MTAGDLLEAFRDDVMDRESAPQYLWSDTEAYRFADQAQKMFCRLTEGIEDSRTDAVTRLEFAAGQEWAPLSPKVLKIRGAYDEYGRPVSIVAADRTPEYGLRYGMRQGARIEVLATGFDARALRAYPTPNVAQVIRLSVFRLPLRTIEDDVPLEIAEQHHYPLLMWMRHLAYNKQDADTYDRRLSGENEAAFRQYCAQAKIEQVRARHPVAPIMYGGI